MFQYPEDEQFFANILCRGDKNLLEKKFISLFDNRPAVIKRREFNLARQTIFKKMSQARKLTCELKLTSNCTRDQKLEIDHLIPLSSNELNKKIRHMASTAGKKVPAQSLGSNHLSNLFLPVMLATATKSTSSYCQSTYKYDRHTSKLFFNK